MGHFRQGIVLVHELRQLTGTKELLDRCSHRFCIDDVLRHQAFRLNHAEAFTYGTFNAYKADTKNVFGHLPYGTNTSITQVIDVVDRTVAVTNINKHLHDRQDVFLVQRTEPFGTVARQTSVELHPANR